MLTITLTNLIGSNYFFEQPALFVQLMFARRTAVAEDAACRLSGSICQHPGWRYHPQHKNHTSYSKRRYLPRRSISAVLLNKSLEPFTFLYRQKMRPSVIGLENPGI